MHRAADGHSENDLRRSLTPLEQTFLSLEEADDSVLMHAGGVLLFGAGDRTPAPSLEQLRARIALRLPERVLLQSRLSSDHAGADGPVEWAPEDDFELAAHVHLAQLPHPSGYRELMEWVADWFSHRLERSRPLWEVTLIDALDQDRWVLVWKAHLSLLSDDGWGQLSTAMFDPGTLPAHEPLPLAPSHHSQLPSPLQLAVRLVGRARALLDVETPVRLGPSRRVASVHFPRQELDGIADLLGASVEDVLRYAAFSGLLSLASTDRWISERDPVGRYRQLSQAGHRHDAEITVLEPRPPGRRAFGAAVVDDIPIGPLAPRHRIAIAVACCQDRATFGIVADRHTVPDVEPVCAGIFGTLLELDAAANAAAGAQPTSAIGAAAPVRG